VNGINYWTGEVFRVWSNTRLVITPAPQTLLRFAKNDGASLLGQNLCGDQLLDIETSDGEREATRFIERKFRGPKQRPCQQREVCQRIEIYGATNQGEPLETDDLLTGCVKGFLRAKEA
jgi:hypothetical protein